EGSRGGARIADEDLGLLDRESGRGADAVHAQALRGPERLDLHAERLKRRAHYTRVLGVEDALERGDTFGERGEQQRAVGDALRPGQADAARGIGGMGEEKGFHRYSFDAGRRTPAAQAWRAARASDMRRSRPGPSPRSMSSRNTASWA